MVDKRLAIIPARGGSKRIPKKNIIDFLGKPMIHWTIEAALKSNCFERVIVSTDDEETAKISRMAGAEVPFLREKYADDFSTVSQATTSALEQAETYWETEFDQVVQLMANCPLRDSTDIKNALKSFDLNKRKFQISCFKFGWMNPWWAAKLNPDGTPKPLFNKKERMKRSQDQESLFCPTGAIWISKGLYLKSNKDFYGSGYCYEELSWLSAIDIDDCEDLAFAQAAAKMKFKTSPNKD